MNKQRIAVLVIASLGILATFMPWSSLPVLGSMSGINTTLGKVSLVLFVVPLIISLIGNKIKELRGGLMYTPVIFSILAVLTGVLHIFVLNSTGSQNENPLDALIAENISVGFGLYIAILAGIMLPIFIFLMRSPGQVESGTAKKTATRNVRPSRSKVKAILKEKKKLDAQPKEEKPASSREVISDLKKESAAKKRFEPSDHSRFMPK